MPLLTDMLRKPVKIGIGRARQLRLISGDARFALKNKKREPWESQRETSPIKRGFVIHKSGVNAKKEVFLCQTDCFRVSCTR